MLGMLVVSWVLTGCGYSLSSSPYSIVGSMSVRVPMATNQTQFGELGPSLTSDIINRLDSSSSVVVRENAPATLTLAIKSAEVPGGAWDANNFQDGLPTYSASRVASASVEATLEGIPNPNGGEPLTKRRSYYSERIFNVGSSQIQAEQAQAEAFQLVIEDLGQKIAQTMFSEF